MWTDLIASNPSPPVVPLTPVHEASIGNNDSVSQRHVICYYQLIIIIEADEAVGSALTVMNAATNVIDLFFQTLVSSDSFPFC